MSFAWKVLLVFYAVFAFVFILFGCAPHYPAVFCDHDGCIYHAAPHHHRHPH